MKARLVWLALAAVAGQPVAAATGAPAAASSPLDPAASVGATLYVSPLAGYMLFDDTAVGDWRRLNRALAAVSPPAEPNQAPAAAQTGRAQGMTEPGHPRHGAGGAHGHH